MTNFADIFKNMHFCKTIYRLGKWSLMKVFLYEICFIKFKPKLENELEHKLGYLYFRWFVIFSNVMSLQFCKSNIYITSMVVIFLSPLLCKSHNLIITLHQKKSSYLDEKWLFIDRFKVKNVLGMRII